MSNVEIERRFLVPDLSKVDLTDAFLKIEINQGYLSTDIEKVIRIRLENVYKAGSLMNKFGYLTIKGKRTNGIANEIEVELDPPEAKNLLDSNVVTSVVEKTRYVIPATSTDDDLFVKGFVELDVFKGDNEGLVIAEFELEDINDPIPDLDWLGEEITDKDAEYSNVALGRNPWKFRNGT